uniref:Ataxin-3 homolog n=1 Tax=Plectus sambesii TaxID=2011161 RepID=A0A914VHI1_9BILA
MESIFFEKQEASLCAQHALNALLQGPFFSAVDLAEIAQQLDQLETNMMDQPGLSSTSQNMDDSGFFSVQVMSEALKVWGLELVPFTSPRAVAFKDDPTSAKAYICNHREHWFTIRRLGFQWFNLNSLLSGPQLVSDTYLHLFLAQLVNDGYTIFVIVGDLPTCQADEVLSMTPLDPALAARSAPVREEHNDDPELARAIALSLGNDASAADVNAALQASRDMAEDDDTTLQQVLKASMADAPDIEDDAEMDRQMQRALQMSLEMNRPMAGNLPTPTAGGVPIPTTGNLPTPTTGNLSSLAAGSVPTHTASDMPMPTAGSLPAPTAGDLPTLSASFSSPSAAPLLPSQSADSETVRRQREAFLKRFDKAD